MLDVGGANAGGETDTAIGHFREEPRAGVANLCSAEIDAEGLEDALPVPFLKTKMLQQPRVDAGVARIVDGNTVGDFMVEGGEGAFFGGHGRATPLGTDGPLYILGEKGKERSLPGTTTPHRLASSPVSPPPDLSRTRRRTR